MTTPHTLDILFLTNFSDYCFRTIPAIAQMADTISARLTILHVCDGTPGSRFEAEGKIKSFFPEADRFASCQRLVSTGDVVEAVQRHLERWPVNLIVAPASEMIGLPRPGSRSLRNRLIKECGVPVWTIGRSADLQKLTQPVRNVACLLDLYDDHNAHLSFAIDYAQKANAKLHLFRALPNPSEGMLTMAMDNQALHPDLAIRDLKEMCASSPVAPEVHVTTGEGIGVVARMLKDAHADVVFAGQEDSLLSSWFGMGPRLADRAHCPTVYVGNPATIKVWNLKRGPAAFNHKLDRLGSVLDLPIAAFGRQPRPNVA